MTRLFRSKSCGISSFNVSGFNTFTQENDNNVEKEEEEELESDDDNYDEDDEDEDEDEIEKYSSNNVSRQFTKGTNNNNQNQFAILDIVVAALKKSLVTCSVDREDVSSLDISWPTEVRHVSHVTFDRFNGFLGLPSEFQPEIPTRVPSARSIYYCLIISIVHNINLCLVQFCFYFLLYVLFNFV